MLFGLIWLRWVVVFFPPAFSLYEIVILYHAAKRSRIKALKVTSCLAGCHKKTKPYHQ